MTKVDQELYLEMSYHQAKVVTEAYSTSFSGAISHLSPLRRKYIYAIYGMVRLGDEVVDAGFDIDKAKVLEAFQQEIRDALSTGFSSNPVIHAFQDTVNKFSIGDDLITAFFKSMEADITESTHTEDSYQDYIYGSAEVVGLMCLAVFCEGDTAKYSSLVEPARTLGSAFQKVNFLRDIGTDTAERGRTYFPGVDISQFTNAQKQVIEDEIENEFDIASKALKSLPQDVDKAVSLALSYFRELLKALRKVDAQVLLTKRVSVSKTKKLLIGAKAAIQK